MSKLICVVLVFVTIIALAGCTITFPPIEGEEATATVEPTGLAPDTETPTEMAVITETPVLVTPECLIKGNVAQGKIYHLPGDASYDQTDINPENGDKWFCTPEQAEAEGFRRAKR